MLFNFLVESEGISEGGAGERCTIGEVVEGGVDVRVVPGMARPPNRTGLRPSPACCHSPTGELLPLCSDGLPRYLC